MKRSLPPIPQDIVQHLGDKRGKEIYQDANDDWWMPDNGDGRILRKQRTVLDTKAYNFGAGSVYLDFGDDCTPFKAADELVIYLQGKRNGNYSPLITVYNTYGIAGANSGFSVYYDTTASNRMRLIWFGTVQVFNNDSILGGINAGVLRAYIIRMTNSGVNGTMTVFAQADDGSWVNIRSHTGAGQAFYASNRKSGQPTIIGASRNQNGLTGVYSNHQMNKPMWAAPYSLDAFNAAKAGEIHESAVWVIDPQERAGSKVYNHVSNSGHGTIVYQGVAESSFHVTDNSRQNPLNVRGYSPAGTDPDNLTAIVPASISNPLVDVLGNTLSKEQRGQVAYDVKVTGNNSVYRSSYNNLNLGTEAFVGTNRRVVMHLMFHSFGNYETLFELQGKLLSTDATGFKLRVMSTGVLYGGSSPGRNVVTDPLSLNTYYEIEFIRVDPDPPYLILNGVIILPTGSVAEALSSASGRNSTIGTRSMLDKNLSNITVYYFASYNGSLQTSEFTFGEGSGLTVYNRGKDRVSATATIDLRGSADGSQWVGESNQKPYNLLNGFNKVGNVYIPAENGSKIVDVNGNPLSNPPHKGHNGAENTLNFNPSSVYELTQAGKANSDISYDTIIADRSRFYDQKQIPQIFSLLSYKNFAEPIDTSGSAAGFNDNLYFGNENVLSGITTSNDTNWEFEVYLGELGENATFFVTGRNVSGLAGFGLRKDGGGLLRMLSNGVFNTSQSLTALGWYTIRIWRNKISVNGTVTSHSAVSFPRESNNLYVGSRSPIENVERLKGTMRWFKMYAGYNDTEPTLHWVFSEGSGLVAYELLQGKQLDVTLNGSADGTQWVAGGNPDYNHNMLYGYHDDGSSLVPGDPNNLGFDVLGNPIDNPQQVTDYRKIKNYLREPVS